jgi:predicted nucleic acid-binding protein
MNVVFADTSFYVGLLSMRDALHDKVLSFLGSYDGRIVTTEFVLIEVANFNSRPSDRPAFVKLIDRIKTDVRTELIASSRELFERGLQLFAARRDKEWSLTDCISFAVMTERGLIDALSADAHFEQAGFRALLREPADA